MDRRTALSLGAGALAATLSSRRVAAQSSGGVIRLIYTYGPGGAGDALSRIVADGLATIIGRPVLVENRTGADGRIAVNAVKNAKPDGETFLIASGPTMWMMPLVHKNPGYDAFTDFKPVSILAKYDFAIAVANNTGIKTTADLISWGKANPTKASCGVLALGTIPHFIGTRLTKLTGVDMPPVVYKGSPTLIGDLVSGQIPIIINGISDEIQQHRAGNIRVVATTGAERSSLLPDVPTLREGGIELVAEAWYGMLAPAGTPPDIISRLSQAVQDVMKKPEIKERVAGLGYTPAGTSPEQLTSDMQAQIATWGPVVKETGYRIEQ